MSQAERYPDVPGFQRFSDTSRAAAAQVSDVETIRQQVYDLIAGRAEGMTADAVAEHFGCYHNRTSPRIRELVLKGLLMDSGERRDTRSGRRAVVWIRAVLPLPVIEDPLVAGQLRLLP